ncbi:ubiquilin-1-like [Eublepharis macularius]|uniref:Ubiquilin-1-like n=1 Tax=Eublepharis macularius TaxID=481883 RepID=A0AA97J3Y8_EUBMA|nr:ubiquilin-1-like [Eublepharis macularius]
MVESQKTPGAELGASAEPRVIRILVKAPWQKEEFLVHQDMFVREFKEHVGRHFASCPDRVVLVHAGRILKDHQSLGQHRIHLDNDATVHVVIRSHRDRRSWQASAVLTQPPSAQKPPPSSALARDGLRELTASLGLHTANFAEFQTQLMSNPDLMLQLLENPSIQSKLSSPDLMKELVTSNPQVQQVMQEAPEISRVLSSPEGMKLVVELAKNPAAVREIMKPPPRALGFPSGDYNSAPQDPSAEMQKGLPKKLLPGSMGGQPASHHSEKPSAKERLLSPIIRPLRMGAQNVTAGSKDQSQGESSVKEGAGQLVSAAVKHLLHQIIRHLMESIANRPSRSSPGQALSHAPELVAKVLRKNAAAPRNVRKEATGVPALLQQIQNTDVLWANSSPKEIQGLLQIQQRLQALATDEPAKRAERAEWPARRAHSNTSLCDMPPPASRLGQHSFSAQRILQALLGADLSAGPKSHSSLRGSSAQPSSKQKWTYKL